MPQDYLDEDAALDSSDAEHGFNQAGGTPLVVDVAKGGGADHVAPAPTPAKRAPGAGKPEPTIVDDGRRPRAPGKEGDQEALDRLDIDLGLRDDDGNVIRASEDEEQEHPVVEKPPTEEDSALETARSDLRQAGYDEEELTGMTPAQIRRSATREQDFKVLKDKLAAAGREAKAETKPEDSGAQSVAPQRTAPDDELEAMIAPVAKKFADDYGDQALGDTLTAAMRGVARTVEERSSKLIAQQGAMLDSLIVETQIAKLQRDEAFKDRVFDDATVKKIADEASTLIAGQRARGLASKDPDGGVRAAFSKAALGVLGSGSPATTERNGKRANGSPSPSGPKQQSRQGIKGMSQDKFESLQLDMIESGRTAEAERLTRMRQ